MSNILFQFSFGISSQLLVFSSVVSHYHLLVPNIYLHLNLYSILQYPKLHTQRRTIYSINKLHWLFFSSTILITRYIIWIKIKERKNVVKRIIFIFILNIIWNNKLFYFKGVMYCFNNKCNFPGIEQYLYFTLGLYVPKYKYNISICCLFETKF